MKPPVPAVYSSRNACPLFASRRLSLGSILCLLAFAICPFALEAQTPLIKANNTDNLNLNSSWTTTPVFDGTEIATWDSTVTGNNSTALGADLSFLGISITNTGASSVTIGGSPSILSVGASGITNASSANLFINAPIELTGDQTWTVSNGNTRIATTRAVDLNGHTLTFAPLGANSFIGMTAGTSNLTGSGSVIMNGFNPAQGGGTPASLELGSSNYTGSTTILGGILSVYQSTALAGSSRLTINGGYLGFGTGVTVSSGVPVSMFGASTTNPSGIRVGWGAGANGQLTIAGTTTLRSGASTVTYSDSSNTGGVTFSTLQRDANLGGILVFGGGVGSFTTLPNGSTRQVFATNGSSLLIGGSINNANAGVVPWVTDYQNNPYTYESGVGFRVLNSSEYRTNFTGSFASGDNVQLSANETLTSTVTVNSLGMSLNNSVVALNLGGNSIEVTSGLVYAAYTTSPSRLDIGNNASSNTEELRFGSQEAILNGNLDIRAKVTGSGGLTVGRTSNTSVATALRNANNSFTGGVRVEQGLLWTGAAEVIPNANSVFVAKSATFRIDAGTETIASLSGVGTGAIGDTTPKMVIGNTLGGTPNNSITLNTGGTLNPGNNSGGSDLAAGRLTLQTYQNNGTVALTAGTLVLNLNTATDYDSLGVNATTVSLTSTSLVLSLAYAPIEGQGFLILANDGSDMISGMFSNGTWVTAIYNSQNYGFEILYNTSLYGGTGNDIALVAAPEPGVIGFLGLAALVFSALRRRRNALRSGISGE